MIKKNSNDKSFIVDRLIQVEFRLIKYFIPYVPILKNHLYIYI